MPPVDRFRWVEWPYGSSEAIIQQTNEPHAVWFETLGLPCSGEQFDQLYRGNVFVNHDEQTIRVQQHYGQFTMNPGIPNAVWEHFATTFPSYSLS